MIEFLILFLIVVIVICLLFAPALSGMIVLMAVVLLLLLLIALPVAMITPLEVGHSTQSARVTKKAVKSKHSQIVCCVRKCWDKGLVKQATTTDPLATRRLVEADPYTPQQLGSVYLGTTAYDATAKKVGIVTCFAYPNLQRDFDTFCGEYGLKKKTLKIHNLGGQVDSGWAVETCLDSQWSHVFAPNSETHVFCAADDSIRALGEAIQAAITAKMDIVSMSLGTDESSSVTSLIEPLFAKNPGIIFLGASGDNAIVSYPSSSPNVISVGGTTLTLASDGVSGPRVNLAPITKGAYSKLAETNWYTPDGIGSGHGISQIFLRPGYQSGHNPSDYRSTPDLSLISASPSSNGVSIYCGVGGGWIGVEGSSVGTPCLAGMLATVNGKRKTPLTRASIMSYLYSLVPSNLPMDTLLDGAGYVSNRTIDALVAL